MVSKTDSAFLNPANNCLVEMDSFPLAALTRARIFCRCYSLVLNVGTLEVVVVDAVVIVVGSSFLDVVAVVVLLLVSRTDLWCYMFLLSVFSNFRMGTAAATPNAWMNSFIEFNKCV
jgi:hypothetical protein